MPVASEITAPEPRRSEFIPGELVRLEATARPQIAENERNGRFTRRAHTSAARPTLWEKNAVPGQAFAPEQSGIPRSRTPRMPPDHTFLAVPPQLKIATKFESLQHDAGYQNHAVECNRPAGATDGPIIDSATGRYTPI